MTRANVAKGKDFERDLAAYLRPWWPAVDRSVRTGYRTADRVSPDHGDVHGVGTDRMRVVIQAKNVTGRHPRGLMGKALDDLLVQTRSQRDAAGAVLGLLVEKRAGYASPGDAWCHLDAAELYVLLDGWSDAMDVWSILGSDRAYLDKHGRVEDPLAPVRMRFGDVVDILVRGGFVPDDDDHGEPL